MLDEKIVENKMGTMPVFKLLVNISLPIIISMFIQALYNFVDSYFVAKISENALTAVSLAFPAQNFMIALGVGTGIGVNAILSKSLGEKNYSMVNKIADNGVFLIFLSYIAMAILGLLFSRLYFSAQTDIGDVVEMGTIYVKICTIFSMGFFFQVIFERLLQATGKTLYSMIIQGSGAIINIILDPILIFGLFGVPAMGVTGAAIATVIGQTIAAIIGVLLNRYVNKEIVLSLKGFKPNLDIIKRIYVVGVPSILMKGLASVLTFGMNFILLGFSPTATAVFGIYIKLQNFVLMPTFGINNGMVPIIAYNYGAKKKERIIKTIKCGIFLASIIMFIGFAIIQIMPVEILMLFSASDTMLEIGVPALKITSIHFILAGFSIVLSGVFQAFSKGTYSLTVSLCRQLLVLLPCAYVFSKIGGINLIWWAFPVAELACLAVCIICMAKVYKNQISKIEE
ncbi:MAG: MATE family efflux transporter [Anaerotignaceae bacterium]